MQFKEDLWAFIVNYFRTLGTSCFFYIYAHFFALLFEASYYAYFKIFFIIIIIIINKSWTLV